jgi:glycosyltransferase involved in cell wall biosynthesis
VPPLHFIVPGPIGQLTGGYLYDNRVVDGLRQAGRKVELHELPGAFPEADEVARRAAEALLAALPDGAAAVIDGLALPAFAACFEDHADRLRLIVFVHHLLMLETGIAASEAAKLQALEAALLPRACGVICPSEGTAAGVAGCGVPRTRIRVVPPGTMKPALKPGMKPAVKPLRLLSIGTITPRKGHLLLVEALAGLVRHDWHLTIIGSLERDRAMVEAVRAAIARHLLGGRVDLLGERPPAELSEAYLEADLFVLPSFFEGYGMVFAEALAHGLPIVATTGGAIPTTVPATAGLLVPPGDIAALRNALESLLTDPGIRSTLARGAVAAGRDLPDWTRTVQLWGACADALIGV